MATSEHESRALKAKRPTSQHTNTAIGPMTFFLRSEAEMDKSIGERSLTDDESIAASGADTSYGVQSLEDAMQVSTDTLSRTSSNESDGVRKKRPGNPIHPKIYATGQRIVSSEQPRLQTRRISVSSAPPTPLNLSPHPEVGTPRTNSIKSFQLSDEEASVASDTGSQAVQSSSSEEDVEVRIPRESFSQDQQLVMPSITMPRRRPFTARGTAMGQLKIMVAGASGLGKTSLVRNMFRLCEDIVHVDGMASSTSSLPTTSSNGSSLVPTTTIIEVRASSKSLPAWSIEHSNERLRRNSYPDKLLDRNLRFVDTPGIDDDSMAQRLLKEVDSWSQIGLQIDSMDDEQLLDLLRGRSDIFLDAVLYLITPEAGVLPAHEIHLLQQLSVRTNVIPLIAKSDTTDAERLMARQSEVTDALSAAGIATFSVQPDQSIYTISSLADDGGIMDASTLMASTYSPPLRPSHLPAVIDGLFEPNTIERLRHSSTSKFVTLRRSTLKQHRSTAVSKGYSAFLRSTSPSSDDSGPLFGHSPYSLPHQPMVEPTRHSQVARWARDLQRSLRRGDFWQEDQLARPQKGRLGGELAVIDPRDPLGILALTQSFGRRGWLALQVVGSCGLITATIWWAARNWIEWHTWFWPSESFSPVAVPAPTRSWLDAIRSM